ncbi:hypothetical protein, partial [Stenotrophomonas sp. HMWF023]|uniref:hypothetical protein n=1 Tax=Stenotrophomonas sp. HMWF023 TaxID=2056859 RepID=UPI001C629D0E
DFDSLSLDAVALSVEDRECRLTFVNRYDPSSFAPVVILFSSVTSCVVKLSALVGVRARTGGSAGFYDDRVRFYFGNNFIEIVSDS